MYGRKVKLRFLFVAIILITLILSIFLVLKSVEVKGVYCQLELVGWLKTTLFL
jgi:cytochrome c-type biogenesis protein CcmE